MDVVDGIIWLQQVIQTNPALLGALFAIIRNLGGWITRMLNIKAFEKWDKLQFGETLALYETFFLALYVVPGVPIWVAAVVAIIVDVIRSLKKALTETK